jgi:polysaccharide biosynthesis transport protein
MITGQELRQWLRAALRWWWIMVIAVGIAGGTAYYLTQQETRFYVARTALMIGNTLESRLPDQNQLSIGWALARYYGELARREPILQPVQESLKLPFTWQLLSDRMLTTNVVPTANLLEVYVTDTNPERAAAIANAIGDRLIAFSPTAPEKIEEERRVVEQQIKESDAKIQEIQKTIADLVQQQSAATSASDLAEINQKLSQFSATLAQEQSSYKSLLNYKSSSIINSLNFFERATPPTDPLPSKRKVVVGSAGLAGLLLALLAIYLLELLDTRVRGAGDMQEQFKINSLGSIPLGPPMLVSPAEFVDERLIATRDAQTNIMLAAAERGTRTLMITSPQSSESRTGFSLDLADLFARSGHKVLIVDADSARSFMTQMLLPHGPPQAQNVLSATEQSNVWAYLQPTPLQNVALLPGQWNPNGAPAMLPSLRWRELVQHLLEAADVIIFDGPAVLNGPDAALLAPHLDGVVLALDPATDNRDEVFKSRERLLHQTGSNLLGAVTFKPTQQRQAAFWRQLRGQQPLSLPPAGETAGSIGESKANTNGVHGPIITPAPVAVKDELDPIIGSGSDDLPDITLEIGANQAIEVRAEPPGANARRPRKAPRRTNSGRAVDDV